MRILVVDDNRSSATALARALEKRGHRAEALFDGASAISRLEQGDVDLVLTDLKMEPVDGMQVLRAAQTRRPPVEVIVFTAYGEVGTAVEAMQLGARDFLTKPVTLEQILARVDDLQRPDDAAAPTPERDEPFVAEAPASRLLLRTLRRIAEVPSHVWIEGEIGSGRGHAAHTIHRHAARGGPFVTWDPRQPLEWPSEGGTVLLHAVDDLPDDAQRELARAVTSAPPGVRLIATASPDARARIAEGTLRPDLYYALAVLPVSVPPLRERREDIAPLFQYAVERFAARYERPVPVVPPERMETLQRHAWPGNVRELFNVAERAVVLGADALEIEVVQRTAPGLPVIEEGFSLSNWLETMERRILMEALRLAHGDRAEAGRLLDVERNTLRYKLNKYGLLDR